MLVRLHGSYVNEVERRRLVCALHSLAETLPEFPKSVFHVKYPNVLCDYYYVRGCPWAPSALEEYWTLLQARPDTPTTTWEADGAEVEEILLASLK